MYSQLFTSYRRPVMTLNAKGADSFVSTTNPVLDLFTYTSRKFYENEEDFNKVVEMIVQAKNFDSELFLKLLKFHRHIDVGNGIKNIYYLCMLVLKEEDPAMYETILAWSYEYPKDILTLARTSSSFSPKASFTEPVSIKCPQYSEPHYNKGTKRGNMEAYLKKVNSLISNNEISLPFEIKLYGERLFDSFIALLKDSSSQCNPMLMKYLAYETSHFNVESHFIWDYLEGKVKDNEEFDRLVNSENELHNDLAKEFRQYLKTNKSSSGCYFTKKNQRKLKKLFNKYVNLTDCLYQGVHSDGSKFGSKSSRDEEIELIFQVIKKTPTLSASKLTNFIKKIRKENVEEMSLRDNLLVQSYDKYLQAINENQVKAKVKGLDVSDRCMEFFRSNKLEDPELESQLSELCNGIESYLRPCFSEEFTFSNFANSLELVLDVSGSMQGTPLNTGLLYFVILARIFKIKQLHYFSSTTEVRNLSDEDLNGSFCTLIRKVYMCTAGSTVLQSAFDTLESNKKSNKQVVIITDGDCDPHGGTSNPFHNVTVPGKYQHLHTNNYIVVNVKQTKMNFPYLGMDPKVCYVTGNNPKTLNGLIKSLVMSVRDKVPITPEAVLMNSLDMEQLELPCPVPTYQMILSNDVIHRLYDVIISNMPPKKEMLVDNDNNHEVNENIEDEDEN